MSGRTGRVDERSGVTGVSNSADETRCGCVPNNDETVSDADLLCEVVAGVRLRLGTSRAATHHRAFRSTIAATSGPLNGEIMTSAQNTADQKAASKPGLWNALKGAASQWMAHKSAKAGAALAYYSIFSIGPLIVVVISVATLVLDREGVQQEVTGAIKGLLGEKGAEAVNTMLSAAGKPGEGIFASIIGTVTLVFAAIGVVVQLKEALNTVWNVKQKPGGGIWGFARSYVFSLAGVLALGFLLLISMLLTAGLSAVGKSWGNVVPEGLLHVVEFVVSFAVISLLFAMMFKWLPDADVAWRDVWLAAIGTAALFEIGKFLIGFYIGKQGLESTYGASASIVVVLIWVYYSAQIVLFGAEFTHVRSLQHGRRSPIADTVAS
jgi:membrane protein